MKIEVIFILLIVLPLSIKSHKFEYVRCEDGCVLGTGFSCRGYAARQKWPGDPYYYDCFKAWWWIHHFCDWAGKHRQEDSELASQNIEDHQYSYTDLLLGLGLGVGLGTLFGFFYHTRKQTQAKDRYHLESQAQVTKVNY